MTTVRDSTSCGRLIRRSRGYDVRPDIASVPSALSLACLNPRRGHDSRSNVPRPTRRRMTYSMTIRQAMLRAHQPDRGSGCRKPATAKTGDGR